MNSFESFVAPVNDLGDRDPLSDWRWLVGEDAEPVLLTAMGDMFVRRVSTGAILFVDALEGSISEAADSYDAWKVRLTEPEKFERWFLPALVLLLRERGLVLADGQCYSPIHPLVLGGELVAENIETTSWRVHFCIAGQIHRQTKNLPPGTKISKIIIDDEEPPPKRWWKLW